MSFAYNFFPIPNCAYTMACKKSVAALKKALAKAQNEIKQD